MRLQAVEFEPTHDARFPILAALLVQTRNLPAYQQFQRQLLTTFSNTESLYTADQVAKACLFSPPANEDLPLLGHLTDLPVTLGTTDKNALPYFQDNKALCEYRHGHFFAGAVEWAQKPLQVPGIYVHGHSYAILAMADWQLGKKDEARAMLAKGNGLDPEIMPTRVVEDPSNAWVAWLFARIQLDEAAALINSNP